MLSTWLDELSFLVGYVENLLGQKFRNLSKYVDTLVNLEWFLVLPIPSNSHKLSEPCTIDLYTIARRLHVQASKVLGLIMVG